MQNPRDDRHVPVLLAESLEALAVRGDGTYVDATFGRGGHSRAILAALSGGGRLIGIDRDPQAESASAAIDDRRFDFRRGWFSELPRMLDDLDVPQLDGVLFDLGVSSAQLDDAQRGFSYRFDGPLDMRMDPSRGESAAELVARATVGELTEVIRDYGEERFAASVARAIAAARDAAPVRTTRQLADVVAKAIGARTRGDWHQDPAARTFQALRIAVNRELHEVATALPAITARLAPGARIAVIAFHSLEDRIVKRYFARASLPFRGDTRLARMPIAEDLVPKSPLARVGRAIKPSADEVSRNPRSRSAILRIAERTAHPLPDHWPRGFEAAVR